MIPFPAASIPIINAIAEIFEMQLHMYITYIECNYAKLLNGCTVIYMYYFNASLSWPCLFLARHIYLHMYADVHMYVCIYFRISLALTLFYHLHFLYAVPLSIPILFYETCTS